MTWSKGYRERFPMASNTPAQQQPTATSFQKTEEIKHHLDLW